MEHDNSSIEVLTDSPDENPEKPPELHTVTPLSKYLAMVLFIAMPFLGGWFGYQYGVDTKVVEVEKVVTAEVADETDDFYAIAREYIINNAATGTEFTLEFEREENNQVVLKVIPINNDTDVARIWLSQTDDSWVVDSFGTVSPEAEEWQTYRNEETRDIAFIEEASTGDRGGYSESDFIASNSLIKLTEINLSGDYYTDGTDIYYVTPFKALRIEGLDPATFNYIPAGTRSPLGHYILDRQNVIASPFPGEMGGQYNVVIGADASSFVVIDDFYAQDKNNVYYYSRLLEGINPDSITYLPIPKSEEYTHYSVSLLIDGGDVYFAGQLLPALDGSTFSHEMGGAILRDEDTTLYLQGNCHYLFYVSEDELPEFLRDDYRPTWC